MERTFEQLTGMDFVGNQEKQSLIDKRKEFENQSDGELREQILQLLLLKKRTGATELIVQRVLSKEHIYTTKNDVKTEMWIYDKGIYKPQGKSYVKEFCRKILHESYTPQLYNEVIAKIEADTFIEQDDFFEDKYVDEVPVQNGILNVRTKKLLAFDPKKIFFNKLPVEFNPNADCPSIDKFLREVLSSEEDILVAYELVGQSLYKEYFTEKAGMLHGDGRNGKGKFLELSKRLVGIENCCSVPINQMKTENSSLCELHNKLLNLAGDLSNTDLKDTGIFKATTGRDILQAHRKFLTDLKFVNHAKHIFSCNELPRVYDTSLGFWERWVLLDFPHTFVDEKEYQEAVDKTKLRIKDVQIIEKIATPEELSGFLNKCLEGLHRLFKNKTFSQTKGSKEIKDYWIRNSDSFTAFCLDNIEEDFEGCISKKDLRKRFMKYCKDHKVQGASDKGIKVTLENLYGIIETRKYFPDKEEQIRVWEGIKFKGDLTN